MKSNDTSNSTPKFLPSIGFQLIYKNVNRFYCNIPITVYNNDHVDNYSNYFSKTFDKYKHLLEYDMSIYNDRYIKCIYNILELYKPVCVRNVIYTSTSLINNINKIKYYIIINKRMVD